MFHLPLNNFTQIMFHMPVNSLKSIYFNSIFNFYMDDRRIYKYEDKKIERFIFKIFIHYSFIYKSWILDNIIVFVSPIRRELNCNILLYEYSFFGDKVVILVTIGLWI